MSAKSINENHKSIFSKRKLRRTKKSSTPGSTKGERCMASLMDRYFATSSRAYKHPGYQSWLEKTRKYNNAK